jgi:hypothetical protein
MTAYFVSSGAEARQGAMGVVTASAGVEIYQFFYGFYRKGTSALEPGDPVAAQAKLPPLQKFDVSMPPPADGRAPPPLRAPDPGDPGGRLRPGAAVPAVPAELAIGESIVIDADAYLLDVVESSAVEAGPLGRGSGTAPRYALFGNPAGHVERRSVTEDRRGGLYSRLAASAEAGLTQGQPEPEPEQAEQIRTPPPPPPDRPGEGGGGGGGGG